MLFLCLLLLIILSLCVFLMVQILFDLLSIRQCSSGKDFSDSFWWKEFWTNVLFPWFSYRQLSYLSLHVLPLDSIQIQLLATNQISFNLIPSLFSFNLLSLCEEHRLCVLLRREEQSTFQIHCKSDDYLYKRREIKREKKWTMHHFCQIPQPHRPLL